MAEPVAAASTRTTPAPAERPAEASPSTVLVALARGDPKGGLPEQIEEDFRRGAPGCRAVPLFLSHPASIERAGGSPLVVDPPVSAAPGGYPFTAAELRALLQAADSEGAVALALLLERPESPSVDWVRLLLGPVLENGFDFVSPCYSRRAHEGLINTGLVAPLMRALFGKRLIQPLGGEFVASKRLAADLLRDHQHERGRGSIAWDAWVVAKCLSGEYRICQSFVGERPKGPGLPPQALSETLAGFTGPLFAAMEKHAPVWQRVRGSSPVETLGEDGELAAPSPAANVAPMAAAFRLGHRELQPLWKLVLPPASLLALQRIAQLPDPAFRMDDALWARVVYDFALGYRSRVMDRGHLLRSMTPLYLAWAAGFLNETQALDGLGAARRSEALCAAFEQNKPYLISRWRWPDSFNP